jgi:hypothetical protein
MGMGMRVLLGHVDARLIQGYRDSAGNVTAALARCRVFLLGNLRKILLRGSKCRRFEGGAFLGCVLRFRRDCRETEEDRN